MKRARIALFGGSFNPPHVGHREIARAASRQFELDEVRFIPANISPLKRDFPVAEAVHRIEMIKLLIQDDDSFSVWASEINRGGISYTADTIRTFKASEPDHDWFLLIGSDAYGSLNLWKETDYIRDNIRIIVYPRSTDEIAVSNGATMLDGEFVDTSSTDIRRLIADEKPIGDLVSEHVERYINTFQLYR